MAVVADNDDTVPAVPGFVSEKLWGVLKLKELQDMVTLLCFMRVRSLAAFSALDDLQIELACSIAEASHPSNDRLMAGVKGLRTELATRTSVIGRGPLQSKSDTEQDLLIICAEAYRKIALAVLKNGTNSVTLTELRFKLDQGRLSDRVDLFASARAAAVAYDAVLLALAKCRQDSDEAKCFGEAATCARDSVAFFCMAVSGFRERDSFVKAVLAVFPRELDQTFLSQMCNSYHKLMVNVSGAFPSETVTKSVCRKKRRAKKKEAVRISSHRRLMIMMWSRPQTPGSLLQLRSQSLRISFHLISLHASKHYQILWFLAAVMTIRTTRQNWQSLLMAA